MAKAIYIEVPLSEFLAGYNARNSKLVPRNRYECLQQQLQGQIQLPHCNILQECKISLNGSFINLHGRKRVKIRVTHRNVKDSSNCILCQLRRVFAHAFATGLPPNIAHHFSRRARPILPARSTVDNIPRRQDPPIRLPVQFLPRYGWLRYGWLRSDCRAPS